MSLKDVSIFLADNRELFMAILGVIAMLAGRQHVKRRRAKAALKAAQPEQPKEKP